MKECLSLCDEDRLGIRKVCYHGRKANERTTTTNTERENIQEIYFCLRHNYPLPSTYMSPKHDELTSNLPLPTSPTSTISFNSSNSSNSSNTMASYPKAPASAYLSSPTSERNLIHSYSHSPKQSPHHSPNLSHQTYSQSSSPSTYTYTYEPKRESSHYYTNQTSLPTPITYTYKEKKRLCCGCSGTCMWAIIVLCVVLGISLAVSLAVVFKHGGGVGDVD